MFSGSLFIGFVLFAGAAAPESSGEFPDGVVSERAPQPLLATLEADPVLAWNGAALELTRRARAFPPRATRALAIAHIAMYDAAMAVEPLAEQYLSPALTAKVEASIEAAVTVAARDTLAALYAADANETRAAADARLAFVPDGPAKDEGIRLGAASAARILANRSTDGAGATVPYEPTDITGRWRPTRPDFRPALLPQWPNVRPFALESGDQFRLPPPPALDNEEYARDQEEVRIVGEYFSPTRTAEETATAIFWADGPGTATPPGQWNAIIAESARRRGFTIAENARLFAMLNIVEADTAIACWDSKYAHNLWRPISAIPLADDDGNTSTTAVFGWTSFLFTPQFPEYPSGHSTFSSAGARVADAFFGTGAELCGWSDSISIVYGVPEEYRCWPDADTAANEAGLSRIYGGIHYRFSKDLGIELGHNVADYILPRALPLVERGRNGWMFR